MVCLPHLSVLSRCRASRPALISLCAGYALYKRGVGSAWPHAFAAKTTRGFLAHALHRGSVSLDLSWRMRACCTALLPQTHSPFRDACAVPLTAMSVACILHLFVAAYPAYLSALLLLFGLHARSNFKLFPFPLFSSCITLPAFHWLPLPLSHLHALPLRFCTRWPLRYQTHCIPPTPLSAGLRTLKKRVCHALLHAPLHCLLLATCLCLAAQAARSCACAGAPRSALTCLLPFLARLLRHILNITFCTCTALFWVVSTSCRACAASLPALLI